MLKKHNKCSQKVLKEYRGQWQLDLMILFFPGQLAILVHTLSRAGQGRGKVWEAILERGV